ncbi:MAG: hypothetical protein GX471_07200, partial [Candidatus Microthrix parvicella]|nr:hypothetical protein [Candidatus Microthrix parvicella]
MADLVIRGAQLVDGTGAKARTADVAVTDGRITTIGDVSVAGEREVDGTGLIYRAYFALPSNLATKEGLHTNAILGFSTMFNKLLQRRTVEFGAVIF